MMASANVDADLSWRLLDQKFAFHRHHDAGPFSLPSAAKWNRAAVVRTVTFVIRAWREYSPASIQMMVRACRCTKRGSIHAPESIAEKLLR